MWKIKSRTIITTTIIGCWCFMLIMGKPVPEQLTFIVNSLIMYWFGEKSARMALEKGPK